MITNCGNYTIGCIPADYIGLSTDTKPTDVPNASSFYEMDTKTLYLFDQQNSVWLQQ
jgi:hypothetical protein